MAVLVVLAAAAYVVVQLVRSVPSPSFAAVAARSTTLPGQLAGLPLPPGAQASVAVEGAGTMTATPGERPNPIASVTKLMSAILILRDHPLSGSAQGPALTITPADVATYQHELAAQDSVVAVTAGEQLSERQALEAALIPSADNVIKLLAQWDAGSQAAFVAKMNAEAARLGLTSTHYADASGVDPATVSTASDQLRVAEIAMQNPVLAQIVSMPQVVLPVAGLQYNVNGELGKGGIVGVKTGWVPQGGASFVFAARQRIAGTERLVLGAIVGERATPALPTALSYGRRLADAVAGHVEKVTVVRPGTEVTTVRTGVGATIPVVTAGSARFLAWPGAVAHETVEPTGSLQLPIAAHTVVGRLLVQLGSQRAVVPLEVASAAAAPSLSWRLTRL